MTLGAVPFRHTKVIHLIRHGQGFHNVAGHKDPTQYLSFDWEDAHLTDFGWQQAEALHRHIQYLPEQLQIDLVVSSPLTRTLETATGVFAGQAWSDDSQGIPLMREQSGHEDRQAKRQAMSTAGCPPIIAHELYREHLGRHPCDKRRALSHYKKQFPAVDFCLQSAVTATSDTAWLCPYCHDQSCMTSVVQHPAVKAMCDTPWMCPYCQTKIATCRLRTHN